MKITQITPTQKGGYDGRDGYVYTYDVTLDDGTTGEVGSKTPNKWQVGDEVVVTNKRETQYGVRLSISKPNAGGGSYSRGGSDYNNPQRQEEINASWALNASIALGKKTPADVLATAKALLDVRKELLDHMRASQPSAQPPAPSEPPVQQQVVPEPSAEVETDLPF